MEDEPASEGVNGVAIALLCAEAATEETMAEVLVEFDTVVTAADGTRWTPKVVARACVDGLWEGWIEFLPMDLEAEPVRTARETEQPNRADVKYWAEGLTQVYFEGALSRALARPSGGDDGLRVPG